MTPSNNRQDEVLIRILRAGTSFEVLEVLVGSEPVEVGADEVRMRVIDLAIGWLQRGAPEGQAGKVDLGDGEERPARFELQQGGLIFGPI